MAAKLYGIYSQVFNCLQPLNVCMSYNWTLRLIDDISKDHDIEVHYWMQELKERIPRPSDSVSEITTTDCLSSCLSRALHVTPPAFGWLHGCHHATRKI